MHCNLAALRTHLYPLMQIPEPHGYKMPKLAKPLTDAQIKTAKTKSKSYSLADGGSLYLELSPTGSKIWRMSYRQKNGKTNRLTFGPYPAVTGCMTAMRYTALLPECCIVSTAQTLPNYEGIVTWFL